ncbi:MAG: SDR family oxidoreductase [Dehalococcoidia bacterium]
MSTTKPPISKIAFVTGASRGIGKAICAHLALRGYTVAIAARSVRDRDVTPYPGTVTETASLVAELGGVGFPVRCDMERPEDIRAAVEKTLEAFGRIDLLINNARYEGPAHWLGFADVAWDEVERIVNCNFRGPMLLCHLVVPGMIEQGGGMILHVASQSARIDNPNLPGQGSTSLYYPATKAGLDRMALGLAKELRPHGIPVIGLSPGPTLTERATVGDETYGYDLSRRHSVHVPAAVVDYLLSCPDPMAYTGRILEAPDFVREHSLMAPEHLKTPFRPGEAYDPYQEPYWQRVLAART